MDNAERTYYILRDKPLELEESGDARNLSCPRYDSCLSAASNELNRLALAKRKHTKTWKLAKSDRTWICDPNCPHRKQHNMANLELLQATRTQ